MNKKAIFITLYLAVACFVAIGTYALIDSEVQKRQVATTEATTEAYVSEEGDQVGLIDSIDSHVANQKEDGTTEYMADQLSPDFECYDSNDPDNPEAVVWYTPTTKATTEEPKEDKTEATTQAPAGGSTTAAPTTAAPTTEVPATEAPATEAPATEAPATEAPATEAPATEAPATEAPATEAPAPEAPAEPAPEAPAE
ncbi:MAG: hypothetical protein J6A59_06955 [Lachnospiraceae bacterium]|nr:hypothetical protein [Lachnospiraceae bacterium]